ncbi:MAG: hydroxymethylbilane synthase [Planctomycetaceae bacterium]
MTDSVIRIATRSSSLAVWQAEYIQSLILQSSPDVRVEIVHVSTTGDQNQTDALRQFGGTGVFTREVQTSVLQRDTDIAVHSLKDLPTESAEGLMLGAVPERAPRLDALLLPEGRPIATLAELPQGARVGTGSPRRQAQLLHVRPDLQMLEIRGNVQTRLRKLDEGEFDAIILAEAGLRRLALPHRISLLLSPPLMFPAIGQGAIGVECRSDDAMVQEILAAITDSSVLSCVTAERSLLRALRAGCHAPLGATTDLDGESLELNAVLLSPDGRQRLTARGSSQIDDASELGAAVARQLLKSGGESLVSGYSG